MSRRPSPPLNVILAADNGQTPSDPFAAVLQRHDAGTRQRTLESAQEALGHAPNRPLTIDDYLILGEHARAHGDWKGVENAVRGAQPLMSREIEAAKVGKPLAPQSEYQQHLDSFVVLKYELQKYQAGLKPHAP